MDRFLMHLQRRCIPTRPQGFTLLEVMVALAILSIALTSIYRLQGQTFLMSGSARFYSMAPRLAQDKLAEIERQNFNDIIDGQGDFGDDFPAYRWTASVEELPLALTEADAYHMAKIEITVSQSDEQQYTLRTYRYFVD